MEDDKDAPARPVSSIDPVVALQAPPPPLPNPTPPQPSSTKDEPAPPAPGPQRLRFAVELRPGETTIVSWKRLLKESGKVSDSPPNAAPADRPLAAQPGADDVHAEGEQKDELPPSNRFSAVIEKIERLYMGNQSSDEELDDIPDDDQYDTEDSFIDDAELDEYFHVDKMSTKHSGFFVNKGNLEQIEACSSPQEAPKRRRRKDPTKVHGEGSRIVVPSDPTNIDNLQVKDASKNDSVSRRKASPKVVAPFGEHHNNERPSKYKSKAITTGYKYKRKSADLAIRPEESSSKSVLYKEFTSLQLESKDFVKHKAGSFTSKDGIHKSRTDDLIPLHLAARNKGRVEMQSKKLLNGEVDVSAKMRRKERYGSRDFPAINSTESAYSTYGMQQASTRVKEGSAVRPKGSTLERAIRDLQKMVAECRPPSLDLQEVDPAFQGIRRRLPREVKQKLAKVARLSASQGKISEDELVDRLMGILGHLVQRKTLKKNVREMVVLGISAKQQKADRFQQIKKVVNEMIRERVSQSKSKFTEQRDGSTDDFQELTNDGTRSSKGRYNMDSALEDKICDLYDLHVEGMDEDKGPQSRKLYVELADLWPSGFMDNVGIKDAIYRSKVRRDEERIKRKKLASTIRVEKPHLAPPIRPGQENPVQVVSTKSQVFASLDELDPSNRGSTGKSLYSIPHSTDSGLQHALKNQDKVRGVNMSTNPNPVETSKTSVDLKKS